ncbi:uncharacterized protein AMSG_00435 [Thecamonas trahens ATCC 50062]|uniref:Cytidyltransferase-like domain-containing protein n=1 Tax=Thecamonas trahens ATCC 50062 TaxID=461836 RepID=A0A0L0D8G0_THETB|nr:hypothetical protein AMSG_00435 [Thecamonas trahens ATCC 50062]KNC48657.1 hypothetical protein AMSG_00435 [Thecamonas trahens ATCC 50062]|eukprot:XP_013762713.1 hypothetical protein AMSG_00435 [Thecamonas trahens ATCC 50062]
MAGVGHAAEDFVVARWAAMIEDPMCAERLCGSTPVVLLATGALSPCHRMHVGGLLAARAAVEDRGLFGANAVVVAGLLSPSHEEYVGGKLGTAAMDGELRLAVVAASIADAGLDGWMAADDWEVSQPTFVDYPRVARTLHARIVDAATTSGATDLAASLRVAYVAGADHVAKCFMEGLGARGIGVVCLPRGMDTVRARRKYPDELEWIVFATDDELAAAADAVSAPTRTSSTLVRQLLSAPARSEEHDAVSTMLFPSVLTMLVD